MTRKQLLRRGLAGAGTIVLAGTGLEQLVSHGVLPGKHALDVLTGACDVAVPPFRFASELGPQHSGSFQSRYRRRSVGYTIAYPPGHKPGDRLPLTVMLHGFGGNHISAVTGMKPAQAVGLRGLPPMALVTVDGGGGYWNPHPRDDPMGMVMHELIPLCRRLGLGRPPHRIGAMGISMGGYGALLFAERFPQTFAAVAAISPAIWTSYAQARGANAGAFASAQAFAESDVISHAGRLAGKPVRVASGNDDPFHPGVVAFSRVVPKNVEVFFSGGCHTGPFFRSQEPASLAFLGEHIA